MLEIRFGGKWAREREQAAALLVAGECGGRVFVSHAIKGITRRKRGKKSPSYEVINAPAQVARK